MDYTLFDAHCDTLSKITDFGGELVRNTYQLDLERIKRYRGGYVQVFAAFVDKKNITVSPMLRTLKLIDRYFEEMEKNKEIVSHCVNADEIGHALKCGKIAAMLSVEGGEAIEGSLENLRTLYRIGVRIMTLTWNYSNEICDGIGEVRGAGLSEFGKNVVLEMNKLGMLIDVSHISVKGFWEVVELSRQPITATHSNVFELKAHCRNLNDEQIKAVIKGGGCIGVNLYPEFVSEGICTITDVIRHIEYILALGGENNVGIGSDFDGIESTPDEINGVEDMNRLIDELLRLGYSDMLVKKILSDNFLRLMSKII